jgi:hypothetical protein
MNVAFCSWNRLICTAQSTELKEKDVGSMKTINSILKHLDKLSQSAVAGEEKDKRGKAIREEFFS